ncbi:MAG: Gfo/Idh/MocA family oxidoreductase [Bryobacteraceae bacterium]|nr:Gfo/Idh/MocA family oxidoreductase [Bryobacteraceae bacterium]
MSSDLNRRNFLGNAAAAAAAFTIVPRNVLGGSGFVAPSDKLNVAYIGLGTEGIREMLPMMRSDEIQIVAVCDPNKESTNYVDWSKDGLVRDVRKFLGNPNWREGIDGIPGGREVGREIVETYYGSKRPSGEFKGCASFADFRELLEKQKDLDAVKIMTPDHLHATISIAAMKKGKHVLMHKPIANRVDEARKVLAVRAQSKVATHFIPWDARGPIDTVMAWINDGAIGKLREVHNWSHRPMWPQYATLPTERPPVPQGFDWDLWLGPEQDRPYSPNYTNAVFRGWYDFGGGSICDMGHYSLWTVFRTLKLEAPVTVEATPSTICLLDGQVSRRVHNDYSFPLSSTIRMRFAAGADRGPIDIFWYEGGIRPRTPEELYEDNQELDNEGMMFVGDRGKILAGFNIDHPRLIPEKKMREYQGPAAKPERPERDEDEVPAGVIEWIEACKTGKTSTGDFSYAGPISEAFNLAAIALRTGKRLQWDAANMKITNFPEANKCLYRQYRKGWEL